MEETLSLGEFILHEVVLLLKLPAHTLYEYPSIRAYGNQYCCKGRVWETTHKSYDSGVASVIGQRCQASG